MHFVFHQLGMHFLDVSLQVVSSSRGKAAEITICRGQGCGLAFVNNRVFSEPLFVCVSHATDITAVGLALVVASFVPGHG